MGIIFPMINSASGARKAVDYSKQAPRSSRSCGGARQKFYSNKESFEDFSEWVDRETLLIMMIETEEAVKNVEEILSVDGVDACFIGPRNLATSMGTTVGSPDHERAIEKILDGAKSNDTAAGIYCLSGAEEANKRIEQGFQLISVAPDAGLIGASLQHLGDKLEL